TASILPGDRAEMTLAQARAGDIAAFADIVRQYEAMVFSIGYRFFNDRSTAEDLAQEVFLRLFRHLRDIDSTAHLRFWLRRVTSRCCIDGQRQRARAAEVALDDVANIERMATPTLSRDVLLEDRLRAYVSALPDHARLVV